MSHVIDHSKKYEILAKAQRKYACPNLEKILPELESFEEELSEKELDEFVVYVD